MKRLAFTAIALACATQIPHAAELSPETLKAWSAYSKEADSRMQARGDGPSPFLWIDESPERAARVRQGEVVIAPVVGQGTAAAPQALIHDWIGAVFIPGASVDDLLSVVHDYGQYQSFYRPVVISSRTLACAGDTQEFQMVWQRKVLFVRAAMQGQYKARDAFLDARRGYNVAEAVEMREIQGYGHTDQRLLPPDTGSGFIWRIRSMSRFEGRDGGVYLELEAIALTRDIPASLAWLVSPVVNRLSMSSLSATLRQTRDAVISSRGSLKVSASCPNPARTSHSSAGAGE